MSTGHLRLFQYFAVKMVHMRTLHAYVSSVTLNLSPEGWNHWVTRESHLQLVWTFWVTGLVSLSLSLSLYVCMYCICFYTIFFQELFQNEDSSVSLVVLKTWLLHMEYHSIMWMQQTINCTVQRCSGASLSCPVPWTPWIPLHSRKSVASGDSGWLGLPLTNWVTLASSLTSRSLRIPAWTRGP